MGVAIIFHTCVEWMYTIQVSLILKSENSIIINVHITKGNYLQASFYIHLYQLFDFIITLNEMIHSTFYKHET
jgi:hypothetical protein